MIVGTIMAPATRTGKYYNIKYCPIIAMAHGDCIPHGYERATRYSVYYARPGRGNDDCDSHGVTNQPPKYIRSNSGQRRVV